MLWIDLCVTDPGVNVNHGLIQIRGDYKDFKKGSWIMKQLASCNFSVWQEIHGDTVIASYHTVHKTVLGVTLLLS